MCLLVTFEATTMAMKMEKAANAAGIKGRLIPLPTEVSAGCGLSFKAPLTEREAIERLLNEQNIEAEQFLEMML